MRDIFHDELDEVGRDVMKMVSLVCVAMQRATRALLDADLATPRRSCSPTPRRRAARGDSRTAASR